MMSDRGMLNGVREYREFMRQAYSWLPKLSDKDVKKLEKEQREKFNRKYQKDNEKTQNSPPEVGGGEE